MKMWTTKVFEHSAKDMLKLDRLVFGTNAGMSPFSWSFHTGESSKGWWIWERAAANRVAFERPTAWILYYEDTCGILKLLPFAGTPLYALQSLLAARLSSLNEVLLEARLCVGEIKQPSECRDSWRTTSMGHVQPYFQHVADCKTVGVQPRSIKVIHGCT